MITNQPTCQCFLLKTTENACGKLKKIAYFYAQYEYTNVHT
jgi:hypothetical protein